MDTIKNKSDIFVLENSVSKYLCTLCKPPIAMCSLTNSSLELHIRELHSESHTIRCIYCSQFVSSVSITKHIDKHFQPSNAQPYICPVCPKSCDTLKSLAQHAINVHQMRQNDIFFKCGHCDEAMKSPSELKTHITTTSLLMYHCCFPDCLVKSRDRGLLDEHLVRYHGSENPLYVSSLSFTCSWPSTLQPIDATKIASHFYDRSKVKVPSCFLCNQCSFGTIHLENFAQHLSYCRSVNPTNIVASLSVTCVLYRCSVCNLTTNVRNILTEHIEETHLAVSEDDAIIVEDFTVPLSEDCVNENYTNHLLNSTSSLSKSFDKNVIHDRLRSLCSLQPDLAACHSVLSKALNPQLSIPHEPHSIDSCEADEVGGEVDDANADIDACNDLSCKPLMNDSQSSDSKTPADLLSQVKTDEYVQLYFNEPAFVNAYWKSGKFANINKAVQQMELAGILEKLRQFASYRVPILGRANQRRVAGCPECLKPFNHGFTDLKKHLMVTHLGIRRDISRFTIDFTHSSRNQYNTNIPPSLEPTANNNNSNNNNNNNGLSNHQPKPLNIRNARILNKQFRKRPIIPLPLTNVDKSPLCLKTEGAERSTFDSSSNNNLCLISDSNVSYSGGAPVHRVIPGTGVSDHCEDLRSVEEVCSQAPVGRGGIVPLDEMCNPIVAAMIAANQSQSSTYAGGTEIFLPKFGRQRIQLAYSLQVFKRLLEAYQVPMPERIQLINRMNHYARMHVIMDVLVPSGAQKRFSCPTCMYTSVHSLADIRKHIMGSHCGISTKRFRLCLRASRHDTTTYRLHSDDRMIRFVEDHRRRQIQLADNHSTFTNSFDSDSEDVVKMMKTDESDLDTSKPTVEQTDVEMPPTDQQEELETQTIETDQYESGGPFDEADDESDNRFLIADGDLLNEQTNHVQSDDSNKSSSNEEFHRRIELPYSKSVLHMLLDKEGMVEQYDDIVNRMDVYSKHYLTVVSRGNRIYAYICICGRRFAVVREEVESDIRPASLADCRRHILGVHARIPQELLTLCCQASRISKESSYKLYADTSLLAMAEQHKFRTSRIQTTRKLEGSTSPSKRPLEQPILPNDSNVDTSSQLNTTFSHSAPSQVAMMRHSASYAINHPLLPMPRAPSIKHEPFAEAENLSLSSSEPNNTELLVNGKSKSNDYNHNRYEPPVNPYKKSVESGLFEDRSFALDLEVPRRLLSPDESTTWSQKLSLPEAWTLERIVRLVYSPAVFDHQVRMLLPENDSFITSLHERMRVYARHSVYIARTRDTTNPSQRIYVCCACLTLSHHGFGDVRKHILGVHAHVPERFKSAAMSSSRLNRDDYSLYTDSQLLQLATTSWRSAHMPGSNKSATNGMRAIRRRFRPLEQLKTIDPNFTTPKRKCLEDDLSNLDPNSFTIEQSSLFESPMTVDHPNGHSSTSDHVSDEYRPPIILTLSRPKAFQSADQSVDNQSPSMCVPYPDMDKAVVDDLVASDLSCSTGSRSRRSMILKSKRPCPTSI